MPSSPRLEGNRKLKAGTWMEPIYVSDDTITQLTNVVFNRRNNVNILPSLKTGREHVSSDFKLVGCSLIEFLIHCILTL